MIAFYLDGRSAALARDRIGRLGLDPLARLAGLLIGLCFWRIGRDVS